MLSPYFVILDFNFKIYSMKRFDIKKQAGAELGQAQLKLELGFTSTKIWAIALMIANCYQLLHITELSLLSSTHTHPLGGWGWWWSDSRLIQFSLTCQLELSLAIVVVWQTPRITFYCYSNKNMTNTTPLPFLTFHYQTIGEINCYYHYLL